MRLGRLTGVAEGLSNVKIGSRAYVARARSSVLVAMRGLLFAIERGEVPVVGYAAVARG
jgi:hypothetical protein